MPWTEFRNKIAAVSDQLLKPPPVNTIRLFKSAVYAILMANTLFLLPVADKLWGPESFIMPLQVPDTPLYQLFFLLMEEWVQPYYQVVIILQLVAGVVWFFGRLRWVCAMVFYLTTIILFTSAHLYVTGGHVFMKLILFYLLFIPDRTDNSLKRIMANLFLLTCKIQLAIVYLFAGLFKLHGEYWLNGEALYYVLSLREFSHPILQDLLLNHPVLLKTGTWIGLAYQLTFPILIWFRKIKLPLLLFGVLFHLLVAFGFGLPDFGLFMIASYTMFISNQTAGSILKIPHQMNQAFQRSLNKG